MQKKRETKKMKCDCDVNGLLKEQDGQYSKWYDSGGYVFCNTHRVHVPFFWKKEEALSDG